MRKDSRLSRKPREAEPIPRGGRQGKDALVSPVLPHPRLLVIVDMTPTVLPITTHASQSSRARNRVRDASRDGQLIAAVVDEQLRVALDELSRPEVPRRTGRVRVRVEGVVD